MSISEILVDVRWIWTVKTNASSIFNADSKVEVGNIIFTCIDVNMHT